ncbi:hypothetical protein AMVITR06b [Betaentomopoxvirus amoorei]|uniref:AMVITR06 n=1 Tax=Amsacta moorei entomopoxvirus TaxID=28321 RepID=Q9DGY1_AMEPV|nr:hypothetical protein AMVITR06a [Amsacta moorei entomopoxvirus]NP_065056.1 hypothetical protein AMVITR06b [Amsacta moorei entomopoxvirus]AAG02978.1 AMVITR06 [Amsacta moorei entomopoxvirus]AAG02996.1 AMVITR06 [Amsacta moorei entomopoxvirus]
MDFIKLQDIAIRSITDLNILPIGLRKKINKNVCFNCKCMFFNNNQIICNYCKLLCSGCNKLYNNLSIKKFSTKYGYRYENKKFNILLCDICKKNTEICIECHKLLFNYNNIDYVELRNIDSIQDKVGVCKFCLINILCDECNRYLTTNYINSYNKNNYTLFRYFNDEFNNYNYKICIREYI